MVDYKKIAKGILLVLLSQLFFLVNITIQVGYFKIDILPNFIGFIFLATAIKIFGTYDKTTAPVLPFAYIMVAYELFSGFLATILLILGLNLEVFLHFSSYFATMVNVYLIYQVYTIIANLCKHLDENRARLIKICRNIQIILSLIDQLAISFYILLPQIYESYIFTIAFYAWLCLNIIFTIYFMSLLYFAKKMFDDYEPIQIQTPDV